MRTIITIGFILTSLLCSGQLFKKKNEEPELKWIDQQLLLVGLSKEEFSKKLTDLHVFKSHMFYPGQGTKDYVYNHVVDIRKDNLMFVNKYDYHFRNDTIRTIQIKPYTWDDWKSKMSVDYDFISTDEQEAKTIDKYRSKNGEFQLWVISSKRSGMGIQVFKN